MLSRLCVTYLEFKHIFVCLVVWSFSSTLENFHLYGDVTITGDVLLCSALMAYKQWGFFSVPHLLWHGASVYNGYLRGPMTLTPIAERLAVELSLPVFTTLSRLGFGHPTFRLRGQRSDPMRHRRTP